MSAVPRVLRFALVGGGPGAFIGAVHRRAAEFDGRARLVAGVFSSDPERSRAHGRTLGLDDRRLYPDVRTMAVAEAALPAGERIDFAIIATPNHLHYDAAAAFLENGFHVVCDKPLTTTVSSADALCERARTHDRILAVTYVYRGYPMIKQARALVRAGAIGSVRRITVEYTQGWLARPIEQEGQRQAVWRTDPERAGAGALGDIGTHAFDLTYYVSGVRPARLLADVATVVPGRRVDDDATVLFQYADGARGVLVCTQVAAGVENDLRMRVAGERATLEWSHARPDRLEVHDADGSHRVFTRGAADLAPEAAHVSRLPSGHPEGFHDAFANVYANVLRAIAAHQAGATPDPLDLDFPTGEDGAAGVRFIETALRSSRDRSWTEAAWSPSA